MKKAFHIFIIIIGLSFIVYYFLCGFTVSFNVSILWIWLATGIVLLMYSVLHFYCHEFFKKFKFLQIVGSVLMSFFAIVFIVFLIIEAQIILSLNKTGEDSIDCIIVLGAAVYGDKPSPVLQSRIDTAYDYLTRNPDTVVIASGGQGASEDVSEGKCIGDALISKGISENRIFIEDQSTTTVENIRNSYNLIPENTSTIGIVTSNFHVFRSVATANSYVNCRIIGIAAPYSGVLLPHYLVREFVTLIVDTALGNITINGLA